MYVYHAPTVTPLARHLPREWEALSNTAKQEFTVYADRFILFESKKLHPLRVQFQF